MLKLRRVIRFRVDSDRYCGVERGKVYEAIDGTWIDDEGDQRSCPVTTEEGRRVYTGNVTILNLEDYYNEALKI